MPLDLCPPLPPRRAPSFTIAAWIVALAGILLSIGAYQIAVYYRKPGEWLPGIGEVIIGFGITAVATFACALLALLRHERRRGWAVPPFVAGLATILYYVWNLLTR